jgi:DNA-binding LacI/PurR family transcriptional regulator
MRRSQYIASKGFQQVGPRTAPVERNALTRDQRAHHLPAAKLGLRAGAGRRGTRPETDHRRMARTMRNLSFTGIDFSRRTALLCVSDAYAMAVMKHLRESGLSVPEDVGCDGIRQCRYPSRSIHPLLTTVEYHVEAWAGRSWTTCVT